MRAVGQAHRLEGLASPVVAARPALTPGIDQGQFHVLGRGAARQQVEGLEDEADLPVADLGQLVVAEAC